MIFIFDEPVKKRLDVFLCEQIDELSRSQIKRQIEEGNCTLNGSTSKCGAWLKIGDYINIELVDFSLGDILPQDIPLDIVYEDDSFAVINKPAGMVVHPACGNPDGTLVNALLFHFANISNIGGQIRPGIVHRIDKDTTGLLVVAKNNSAHLDLAKQIEHKVCHRFYYALLEGVIKDESGEICQPIGRSLSDRKKMCVTDDGKYALSLFRVIERFDKFTLCEFELKTGRTHQIRVHAKFIGHPVVGDKTYGFAKQSFNLCSHLLHAHKLVLLHPVSHQPMQFDAPIPPEFDKVLQVLRKKNKSL